MGHVPGIDNRNPELLKIKLPVLVVWGRDKDEIKAFANLNGFAPREMRELRKPWKQRTRSA